MTSAEFLEQSPAALELLEWLADEPAREVTVTNSPVGGRAPLHALRKRGLVSSSTVWPKWGNVVTYYRVTASGWLALRERGS